MGSWRLPGEKIGNAHGGGRIGGWLEWLSVYGESKVGVGSRVLVIRGYNNKKGTKKKTGREAWGSSCAVFEGSEFLMGMGLYGRDVSKE